jgi:hypothetical protein
MALASLSTEQLDRWLRANGAHSWSIGPGSDADLGFWPTITGQSLKEAKDGRWYSRIHPDDRERVRAAWNTAFAHGQPYNTDMRIHCADGTYRWFNARAAPERSPDGDIVRWVGLTMTLADLALSRTGMPNPTAERCNVVPASVWRAARAMVNWSAETLSERSGVSVSTIRRLETNDCSTQARKSNVERLIDAYRGAGLVFVDRDGDALGIRWSSKVAS